MGVVYESGRGVEQNEPEAFRWYNLAALQGHIDAQVNLGVMYFQGRGTLRDVVKSHSWFSIAASQGDRGANDNMKQIASRMTNAQLEQARSHSKRCLDSVFQDCD